MLFGIFVGAKVYAGITAMVAAVNLLRGAFVKQAAAAGTAAVATAAATGGASLVAAGVAIVAFTAATGIALGALNSINKETEKTAKSAGNLREHMARVEGKAKATAKQTKDIFNFTNKSANEVKKTTAEEAKRLELVQAISKAKLGEFGITNISTTDPVSLEAARLNLVKEGATLETQRWQAMQKFYEQQAGVNLLAARYADILSVINDRQVSPAEVALLAKKWGETEEAVIKYLAYVTNAPLPQGWDNPGNAAADGWNAAITALNNYYRALGQTPIPTLPGAPSGNVAVPPSTTIAPPSAGTVVPVPIVPTVPSIPSLDPFAGTSLAGVTREEIADIFGGGAVNDIISQNNRAATVTVNVSGTGGLDDQAKRDVVNAVVEASGIGYSTGWYRTTGNIAV